MEQAELNAAEYDRMTALLKESTRLEQEYHRQLMDFMKQYEQQQRTRLSSLLDAFAYLADDDTNYERAVYAILNYADQVLHCSIEILTRSAQQCAPRKNLFCDDI